MKELNYYKELIELIDTQGYITEFKDLYKKHFGKLPDEQLCKEYLSKLTEEEVEYESYDSYSYDDSYDEN